MRKILRVPSALVAQHLILTDHQIHLIDAGFLGSLPSLSRTLHTHRLSFADIDSLILTHGHLDHILHAKKLQELCQCPIYAPLLDRDLIHTNHPYSGPNRLCGLAEKIGKHLLQYTPPEVTHWFSGDEELLEGISAKTI